MIIFGREPSPWTTSVFNKLEYSIRGVFNKWGNTVVRTLSKLDQVHVALEQGLAFKACGRKICYVAPSALAEYVMNAIADVYGTQFLANHVATKCLLDISCWHLDEEDMDIMKETENTEMFGRWITIPLTAFSRETLENFVSRDDEFRQRVATNGRGDCMFFCRRV